MFVAVVLPNPYQPTLPPHFNNKYLEYLGAIVAI